MRKIFFAVVCLLLCGTAKAQNFVPIVSGVATVDASLGTNAQTSSFLIILNQNVSSMEIIKAKIGQQITIIWQQDATGSRTVSCAADVLNCVTITSTANAVTSQAFAYNTNTNKWIGASATTGGAVSGVSSVFTRTGAVTSQTGDYTCAQVTSCGTATSGTNLVTLATGVVSCLDVSPACVPDNSVLDATTTNGSAIITCPNSDCHFLTTAAIGNVLQCGAQTVTAGSAGIIVNTTTILSVDSDTQIHASVNATGSTTAGSYCAWGVDNTASMDALNNASTKICKYGFIPSGQYFTSHPEFNSANANCSNGAAGRVGGIIGAGPGWINSKLLVLYTLSYAACTGGGSGHACFLGILAQDDRAVAVDLMYNNTSPGVTQTYIAENNAGYWDRVGISGAQGNLSPATVVMSHFMGIQPVSREGASVGGNYACLNDGSGTELTVHDCLLGGTVGLFGNSGSFTSIGNYHSTSGTGGCGGLGGSCATYCGPGAVCDHKSDHFPGGIVGNAGTAIYQNAILTGGSNFSTSSGGISILRDTSFGAATTLTNASGGTFIDGCGNNLITNLTVTNSGVWSGDCSISGTILATGNVAISSCGTSSAGTFSGSSRKGQFTITFAGTPGTSCVATVTYPVAFVGTTPVCTWYVVGGTNTPATTIALGAQSKTSSAVTFSGPTFTNANTMIVQYECLSP